MSKAKVKMNLNLDELNMIVDALENARQPYENGGTDADRQHIIDINEDKWINEEWYDPPENREDFEKELDKRIDREIEKIIEEYDNIITRVHINISRWKRLNKN